MAKNKLSRGVALVGARPEQIKIGAPMTVAFVERGEGEARRTFPAFEPAN